MTDDVKKEESSKDDNTSQTYSGSTTIFNDTQTSYITLYGATSFTGKHVLKYFMQTSIHLPAELKLTLAGRNKGKLEELKKEMETKMESLRTVHNNPKGYCVFDIFVADSSDVSKIKEMVKRTKVIANTAGPFAQYGSNVVAACAELGTDYVDITGEFSWASEMRVKYGEAAGKSGARIIPMCGFDSVPSDLAVFAAIKELHDKLGGTAPKIHDATTWHAIQGGGFNGGTIKTIADWRVDVRRCWAQPVPFLADDPLCLAHPRKRFDPNLQTMKNNMAKAEWLNQLPSFDSITMGASAPFFMAAANAKVVYASAVALDYATPDFTYRERMCPAGFHYTMKLKFLSIIPAVIVQSLVMILIVLVRMPVLGNFITSKFFPPGSGPSENMCRDSKTEVYVQVSTAENGFGKVNRANIHMEFTGDPGNYVTAQCLCESALALLLDKGKLPPNSEDGFGTPAQLLGSILFERLTKAKVRPLKVFSNVRKNVDKREYVMHI